MRIATTTLTRTTNCEPCARYLQKTPVNFPGDGGEMTTATIHRGSYILICRRVKLVFTRLHAFLGLIIRASGIRSTSQTREYFSFATT